MSRRSKSEGLPDLPSSAEPSPGPSRWRLAWRVLLGEPVVPQQVLQEWLSYRLLFDDLLQRFSALLARQAKAEHARLRAQLEPPSDLPAVNPQSSDRKASVRRRAAEARGLAVYRSAVAAPNPSSLAFQPQSDPPPEEEEEP